MTDEQRQHHRDMADEIIALAERLGYSEDIRVSSSAPAWLTIRHLRSYIEPEYHQEIKHSIWELKQRVTTT